MSTFWSPLRLNRSAFFLDNSHILVDMPREPGHATPSFSSRRWRGFRSLGKSAGHGKKTVPRGTFAVSSGFIRSVARMRASACDPSAEFARFQDD